MLNICMHSLNINKLLGKRWLIDNQVVSHTCFRAIMSDVRRDNRVLSIVGKTGLKGQLVQMLDQLQRCQKSLNEFLEVWTIP